MTDTNGQCQKSADNISIACGDQTISLKLPRAVDIIDVQNTQRPLTEGEIFHILENDPIYSCGLSETIKDAGRILIILPDSTRKSGAEKILPRMIAEIERNGIEFHFMIAVGTHRQATEEELKTILTPEIYEKHRDKVVEHHCENYQENDFYGITKRKTTVLINKQYREHDTIITIGSVSYHYFAGYGGGRKLIVPGIAAKKTTMANHMLALDVTTRKRHERAVTGNMKNNPVHDDLVECVMIARSAHHFFAINTLVDSSGGISALTCGDLFMSHIKAAELLDKVSSVHADTKYDLMFLSAGGFPKDINMVQAQKSLDRIAPLLTEGAKVVFFAECADGYGNSFFEEFFDLKTSEEMLDSLLGDYQINRQTAYNLKTRLEKFDVYLYSDFSEEDCTRMGFKKLKSPEEAAEFVSQASHAGFVPHAYNIFPR